MIVFLLSLVASAAALFGGYIALRSRRWINWALALTAGIVLGLVAFDLLPEIFGIVQARALDAIWPMTALLAGFLLFHAFEKMVPIHEADEERYGPHVHPRLGTARAAALSGHSFLDGLSIGVAFQVNNSVGAAVALAVIGHRFADGFDTTTFMVYNKNKLAHIKAWLLAVALMPVLGGLVSMAFDLSEKVLAIYLGFFAGLLLYIAASNILPQAHSAETTRKMMLLTVLGAILMLIVTRLT